MIEPRGWGRGERRLYYKRTSKRKTDQNPTMVCPRCRTHSSIGVNRLIIGVNGLIGVSARVLYPHCVVPKMDLL